MATKTVSYSTKSELSCGCTQGAGVILCCSSSLTVANEDGVSARHIEATLLHGQRVTSPVLGNIFQYVFSYDDTQLRTGAVFSTGSIQGVKCKDCLTNYAEDLVNSLILGNGDGNLILDAAVILPIVEIDFSTILTTYLPTSFLDGSQLLRYIRITNNTNENIYVSFDGVNNAAYIPLYDIRDYPLGENFTYLSATNVWLKSETAVPVIGNVIFEGFY